jgi:hypothetical protein
LTQLVAAKTWQWIQKLAPTLQDVGSIYELSNEQLHSSSDLSVFALLFCSIFNNCGIQAVDIDGNMYCIGGLKKEIHICLHNLVSSVFSVLDNTFESPLGRQMAIESLCNHNRDDLSYEQSTLIPGGVAMTNFRRKMLTIASANSMATIRNQGLRDLTLFDDNNAINRYKEGTCDLQAPTKFHDIPDASALLEANPTTDHQIKRVISIWTSNSCTSTYQEGFAPVQTDPQCNPMLWKKVRGLCIDKLLGIFEFGGGLNNNHPDHPTHLQLLDSENKAVYIAAKQYIMTVGFENAITKQQSQRKNKKPKILATQFRERDERKDQLLDREIVHGQLRDVTSVDISNASRTPSPLPPRQEIINVDLPNSLRNPACLNAREESLME